MIRAIQIIDSLQIGGAERVAVNYANGLASLLDASHICATREEGLLLKNINKEVSYVFLNKKSALDVKAIFKLKNYITQHKIDIIHAHSSSFFIATLVKIMSPKVKIVWHDHYGNSEFLSKRPKFILRLSSRLFSYIFSVNSKLKAWSLDNLLCKRVEYIKNFPVLDKINSDFTILNGTIEKRVLCLANLREQKNHIRLLEAFEIVKNKYPDWTLHCVGKDFKDLHSERFFFKLNELGLNDHVYFYNSRSDILNILQQCTIGMLISKSEGLPLALLEYGIANLPVISTNVGNCGMLIPDKSYGILLGDDDKENVANAILCYIKDLDYRRSCAHNFNLQIEKDYSSKVIFSQVLDIYKRIMSN